MPAEFYKILGQSKPAAGTLTTLYTSPASAQTIEGRLVVCNQASQLEYFRVSTAVANAADDPSQYLSFDAFLLPNQSAPISYKITLGPTDVVRVQSRTGQASFTLFGVQVT